MFRQFSNKKTSLISISSESWKIYLLIKVLYIWFNLCRRFLVLCSECLFVIISSVILSCLGAQLGRKTWNISTLSVFYQVYCVKKIGPAFIQAAYGHEHIQKKTQKKPNWGGPRLPPPPPPPFPPGMFRFVTLPLEIPEKISSHPCKFCKIW